MSLTIQVSSDDVNNNFKKVFKNLSDHRRKEAEFLKLPGIPKSWEQIPENGDAGDFRCTQSGATYELKVDLYAKRNDRENIFVEFSGTSHKGDAQVKGVCSSVATYFLLVTKECELLIIPRGVLLMTLLTGRFETKSTGIGKNGNIGSHGSNGFLVPLVTLKEIALDKLELPPDFFELWSAWGVN